ncbi:MAG: hypothetical protein DMG57_37940 [Acidobacteria bacterium]|nr:MAG: hypothetical protein DMG57_37940 [Acidobacteriota bacterium]
MIAVSAPDGVIRSGTNLGIRTIETINSRTAVEGRTHAAEISRDVVNGSGRVLIPKGSPARIAIIQTKDSGKISGAEVQFALRTVTVNGKNYDVSTASMKRGAGLWANRQTAETVGTGAVLGTMIGAAAGHGKGAALGRPSERRPERLRARLSKSSQEKKNSKFLPRRCLVSNWISLCA